MSSAASVIEPTRISLIAPTATAEIARMIAALRTRPVVFLLRPPSSNGLKTARCVFSEKIRPSDVADEQHIATASESRSTSLPKSTALLAHAPAARRRGRAGRGRAGPARRARARASPIGRWQRSAERLLVALRAADEHRRAQHEQDVADDRADERGLDDLLEAFEQREERDDQLGRVAERHVQQAADAGAALARRSPPSPRPSPRRTGSRASAAAPKISTGEACTISSTTAIGMNTPRVWIGFIESGSLGVGSAGSLGGGQPMGGRA